MILSWAAAIFVLLFFGVLAIILSVFILHFFIPKTILQKYFKPPYFNTFECDFFSGIPYGYMRTVMFLAVIAYPNRGKKRGLTEVHKLAPSWLRIVAKIVVSIVLGIFVLLIPVMIVILVHMALEP